MKAYTKSCISCCGVASEILLMVLSLFRLTRQRRAGVLLESWESDFNGRMIWVVSGGINPDSEEHLRSSDGSLKCWPSQRQEMVLRIRVVKNPSTE